jgi:hypothetical protein
MNDLLGKKVKDQISGFTGVVTGVCHYITGCHQLLIQPACKLDGDAVESRWMDMDRCEVMPDAPITLTIKNNGPDRAAPRR